ncbi:HU family DNA-binding protein [Dysgonomonas sp. 216]|uniref:HU family DNA-binding protein n=1 Tax=Dysgonomonas sp. 216 TaxID=2302934 RepID=UPI0013D7D165|nr:HU family DNA-binding protein [Dysgonomonas sp. 216]NDW18917.1 HU family DNA-binding protein [Dysgonomonas sp. 216]
MKEKLTLQDLVDLLAKQTSLTKKEADAFFREFFNAIIDDVFGGEPVKIKDFGTFKLTKVSSRESVNVNTGEKIEIPTHYKLSFLPDKILKSLVNKPFEGFETTLVEEGVSFGVIEESEESVELLEEEDTATDDIDVISSVVNEKAQEALNIQAKSDAKTNNSGEQKNQKIETPYVSDGIYSYPVVYTYATTETPNEEDSITMIVSSANESDIETVKSADDTNNIEEEIATQDVSGVVSEPESEKIEVSVLDNAKPLNEEDKSQSDRSDKEVVVFDVTEPIEAAEDILADIKKLDDSNSIDAEKIQEKIQELQLAIEKLNQAKIQKELETQKETQGAEDEGLVEQTEQKEPIVDEDYNATEEIIEPPIEETAVVSEHSLEDSDLLEKLEPLDKAGEDIEVTASYPSDIEDQADIVDEGYYDYYKESAWTRIRRRMPIILFLLATIAFGAYLFFNLFENTPKVFVPDKKTFTSSGTLPGVASKDSDVTTLHSEDIPPIVLLDKDSLNRIKDINVTPESVDSVKKRIEGLAKTYSSERSPNIAEISDILKIRVVRKAEALLNNPQLLEDSILLSEEELEAEVVDAGLGGVNNNGSANVKNVVEKNIIVKNSEFPKTVKVQAGNSLRSIASKQYGNYIYWVYIYQENKDKIPNIDNLLINMELTIPALDKYGVADPKDQTAVDKAKILDKKITTEGRRNSNNSDSNSY